MTRAISRVPKSSGPQPKRWQAERGRLAAWRARAARRAVAVAAGASPAGGTGAASSGGEMMGQMVGQVGQQVGQLGQSLSGLTQGLLQLPQQVMQGVQQAVGQATQAAQSGEGKPGDDKAGESTKEAQEPENSPHSGDHGRSGPPSDGAARRGRTRSITHGGTGTRRRTTPGTDAPAGRRVGAIACGRDPRRRCGAAAPAV